MDYLKKLIFLLFGATLVAMPLMLAWFWLKPDAVDTMMENFLSETGLPGGVIVFGWPGKVPDMRAYGLADSTAGIPMRTSDRFKIASLSKPITAAAILVLIRSKKFNLDTPLVDLLPDVEQATDIRMAKITIRNLLQHSGGWDREETFDPFFIGENEVYELTGINSGFINNCDIIAYSLLNLPLQFDPGSQYAYSNIGYCWLGGVLAKHGGGSYEKAVHALLPETAEMTLDSSRLTVHHHIRYEDQMYLVNRPSIIAAAGGWIASAMDYFRFASRPVDPMVLERPSYASGTQHYGLGWRVWMLEKDVILTHFGAMPGVFSVVFKRKDGPAFVALFNGRPENDEMAFRRLLEGAANLLE